MTADNSRPEHNYASLIFRHIIERPEQQALVLPTKWDDSNILEETCISYGELGQRVAQIRQGLKAQGFKAGDRIIVLFPVSLDLYAVIIALLASAMVPVFIDTGMSLKRIRHALQASHPAGVISCRAFLRLRWLVSMLRKLPLFSVDSHGFGVKPFSDLLSPSDTFLPVIDNKAEDHALITFTSGTTGLPKAADRNHGLLIAQYHSILKVQPINVGDSYLTCFPVFTLMGLACGVTSILPPVNFRKVSDVNGALVLKQIVQRQADYLAVGPAFLEKVVDALALSESQDLPLKALVVGGAPVSPRLCQKVVTTFSSEMEKYVAYGSTEAEPIAHITMETVLAEEIAGNLVGLPEHDLNVKVVRLPPSVDHFSNDIPKLDIEQYLCPHDVVGEIILSGEQVLPRYLDSRDNAKCKILDNQSKPWHRIGDRGYLRADGQLVLVGRVGQEFQWCNQTIDPLTIETPLVTLPFIRFAALLLHPTKNYQLVLCLELEGDIEQDELVKAIETIFVERQLHMPKIYPLDAMPVDGRHNSKIDRHRLKQMLSQSWPRAQQPLVVRG